jgi:hypothetical protein
METVFLDNVLPIPEEHASAALRVATIRGLRRAHRRRECIENEQHSDQDLREGDAALDIWLKRRRKSSRPAA